MPWGGGRDPVDQLSPAPSTMNTPDWPSLDKIRLPRRRDVLRSGVLEFGSFLLLTRKRVDFLALCARETGTVYFV